MDDGNPDKDKENARIQSGYEKTFDGKAAAPEKSSDTPSSNLDEVGDKEKQASSPSGGEQGSQGGTSSPGQLGQSESNSLYKGGGDKGDKGIKQKATKKAVNFVKKHKLAVVGGGLGIGALLFLILFILFLLGSLLLPHFAENIMAYQFAKVTRASEESEDPVMEEYITQASEPKSIFDKAAAKYDNVKEDINGVKSTVREATWGKLDSLRPNIAVENLQESGNVHFNYDGNGRLKSIDVVTQQGITGEEYATIDVAKPGLWDYMLHPAQLGQNLAKSAEYYQQAFSAVNEGLKLTDPDMPSVFRWSATLKYIHQELGTTISGQDAEAVENDTPEEAEAATEEATVKVVNDTSGAGQTTDEPQMTSDENAAVQAESTAEAQPGFWDKVVSAGGLIDSSAFEGVITSISLSSLTSVVSRIVGWTNPLYAIAVPLCMIYEGSIINVPTAQANSNEVQREAVQVLAVADQQKRGGYYYNATLAGAWNWKLNGDDGSGGAQASIPLLRAGGLKVNTLNQTSTQGTPMGGLNNNTNIIETVFSHAGIPGGGVLSSTAATLCPTLTNMWVGIGLGVLNIVAQIFDLIFGGGIGDVAVDGGEVVAEDAAEVVVESSIEKIVAQFTTKEGLGELKELALSQGKELFSIKTGKQLVLVGGLTAGVTFLARLLVLSDIGALHSGAETGPTFDNDVDDGANQLGNAIVCQEFYGRPLTNVEAIQGQSLDKAQTALDNQSQSVYNRYISLDNSSSLSSQLADKMAVSLNHNTFSSVLSTMGSIFDPLSVLPNLFGSLSSTADAAGAAVDTQDYGNVQCGWSTSEESLIQSTPSYNSPSENEYVLDTSNQEPAIASTYGPCFTTPMATLVAQKDVIRDDNGNISQTQGLCSPQNLGPNNPQYGDLVFRYRLFGDYNTTLDMMQGLQTAQPPLSPPAPPS